MPPQDPLIPLPTPGPTLPKSGPDIQIFCPSAPDGYRLIDVELDVFENQTCVLNLFSGEIECSTPPPEERNGVKCKVKCVYQSNCSSTTPNIIKKNGGCSIQVGLRLGRPSPPSA